MTWMLLNEIGIQYASSSSERSAQQLNCPTYAERDDDGTYLIVDELAYEKGVPVRLECRTLRVDANGKILYDSIEQGIDDGYGQLLGSGRMAILRRAKWELYILTTTGKLLDRLMLSAISKRMPRFMSWTWRQTFLIVFLDQVGNLDIVELNDKGHLLWFLPNNAYKLGVPGSVQLLPTDHILVADEVLHLAVEIDRDGACTWHFGKRGNASQAIDCLSTPKSITHLHDYGRLIADTRNHRILCVSANGVVCEFEILCGHLCSPTLATQLANGNFLICDSGNARVIEVDAKGNIVWQYGEQVATNRWFSYPRSVEVTETGAYLISDTAHNRVVEVQDGILIERPMDDEIELFWPRCVRRSLSGSLLIADGRNSRVVEMTAQGKVLRQLRCLAGEVPLKDPHDVRELPNGHLLIVDADLHRVVECDWSGHVYWTVGSTSEGLLKDPHSAQRLPNGQTLICDTGHNRIIYCNRAGKIVQEVDRLASRSSFFRLNRPRYTEVSPDGVFVVVDTGNNRVLAATTSGDFLWELSRLPESRLSFLSQPRWAYLMKGNEVVVCDHYHHRILHLKHEP